MAGKNIFYRRHGFTRNRQSQSQKLKAGRQVKQEARERSRQGQKTGKQAKNRAQEHAVLRQAMIWQRVIQSPGFILYAGVD